MPLISVVVLAYNISAYLPNCLRSVASQTLRDFEAIIVDDGSTDNTGLIAERFCATDPRFRLIQNKKNLGTFISRRTGVAASISPHFCIIDGDDCLAKDYLAMLYAATSEADSDVTECAAVAVTMAGEVTTVPQSEYSPRKLQGFSIAGASLRGAIWHVTWNKLFSRNLFLQALPLLETIDDHVIVCDDKLFTMTLLLFAQLFIRVDRVGYFYRIRRGSATHGISSETRLRHVEDTLLVDKRLLGILKAGDLPTGLLRSMQRNHRREIKRLHALLRFAPPSDPMRALLAQDSNANSRHIRSPSSNRVATRAIHCITPERRPGDYFHFIRNIIARRLWIARHGSTAREAVQIEPGD